MINYSHKNNKSFTLTPFNNKGVSSQSEKGFTLIETLVGSAIFLVVALATYGAFNTLMSGMSFAQAKITAVTVANEKFEIIRNLSYENVGIVDGLPVGKINRNQIITRDGYTFNILTTIRNTDDPFDGTIEDVIPDTSPADYKLVDLDITCLNCKIFNPIKLTTIVAPRGLETASSNGALFIRIFDASGLPVTNTDIHIVNTLADPDIIVDEITDNSGWVKIVDAPPGINAYNITASKTGYTKDQTYPLGGTAGADPLKPDQTVILGGITQTNLSIDKVSSLQVASVDATCTALPNIGFSLTGTKIIGNPDVLKYDTQNFTTGSASNKTISSLEWDDYKILLTSPSYDLAGATIFSDFTINPDENKNIIMTVVPHENNAILVSVKDIDGNPVDGANVRLEKSPFDENKNTNSSTCGDPGQAFWNGLETGTYTLTVSKAGYTTSVSPVDMSSLWQNKEVILELNI